MYCIQMRQSTIALLFAYEAMHGIHSIFSMKYRVKSRNPRVKN